MLDEHKRLLSSPSTTHVILIRIRSNTNTHSAAKCQRKLEKSRSDYLYQEAYARTQQTCLPSSWRANAATHVFPIEKSKERVLWSSFSHIQEANASSKSLQFQHRSILHIQLSTNLEVSMEKSHRWVEKSHQICPLLPSIIILKLYHKSKS